MADNEKKSGEKAELAADAVKDKRMRRGGYFIFGDGKCVEKRPKCCKKDGKPCEEMCGYKYAKTDFCTLPLCVEYVCRERQCGDRCRLSHWDETGYCNSMNECVFGKVRCGEKPEGHKKGNKQESKKKESKKKETKKP